MRLLGGASNVASAASVGKYFYGLLEDPTWIRRRVETISLVDLRRIERRVTLDLDGTMLLERAQAAGIDTKDPDKRLPVPLTLLAKNLILDVDVRDSTGSAKAMVTSDEDSGAAHAVLLYLLDASGQSGHLTSDMIGHLYGITRSMPSEDDLVALARSTTTPQYIEAYDLDKARPGSTQLELTAWASFFDDTGFASYVVDFTRSFLPIIYVDADKPIHVIKYRYVESEQLIASQSPLQRLGLRPTFALVEAPAIGRAQREHLRLLAPTGVNILSMGLGRLPDVGDQAGSLQVTQDKFQARSALERAVVYSNGVRRGEHFAYARIQADSSEFLTPALFAVALSAVLLVLGGWYQRTVGVFSDAQSTIALVLALPSIAAAFLARRGEHRLLGLLLSVPRLLVGLTAVGSLAAAASLVARPSLPENSPAADVLAEQVRVATVWFVAGGYCVLVALLLGTVLIRTFMSERAATGDSPRTIEDRIAIFPRRREV